MADPTQPEQQKIEPTQLGSKNFMDQPLISGTPWTHLLWNFFEILKLIFISGGFFLQHL